MSVRAERKRQGQGSARGISSQSGFTLVEILVAMAVFAVLGVAAHGALSSVLFAREAVLEDSQRLARIQKTMLTMGRDMLQAMPRPVRDGYGQLQPAMGYEPGSILALTRGGRMNPTDQPRSSLQRVGYQLEDGTLYRLRWLVLDPTSGLEPARQVLLDRVDGLSFRFQGSDDWVEQWPPFDQTDHPGWETLLPRAVEVVLELEDLGTITRILLVLEV